MSLLKSYSARSDFHGLRHNNALFRRAQKWSGSSDSDLSKSSSARRALPTLV